VNKDRKDGEGGMRRSVSEKDVKKEDKQQDEEEKVEETEKRVEEEGSTSYTVWMWTC
jgi:hypothetical protein